MAWAQVAAAVGGAGVQALGGMRANKEQQKQSKRARDLTAGLQREGDASLNQMLRGMSGQTPDQDRARMYSDYISQLQQTRPIANSAYTGVPMANARYAQDVRETAGAGDSRSRYLADILSRLDAPQAMRQRQGDQMGRVQAFLSQLGARSGQHQATADLLNQNTMINPWVAMAGQAAQNYGQWAAGNRKPHGTATSADPSGNIVNVSRY
jgi:hypothetical protein